MKQHTIFFLALLVSFAGSYGLDAKAEVVAHHEGSNDPVTEGWSVVGTGNSVSVGLVDDAGTPAWKVDDDSTVSGSALLYEIVPTSDELTRAEQFGWVLRLRLRVVDISDAVDFSVSAGYVNGSGQRFEIKFGSDADGDPIVELHQGGPSFTLEGAGSTYHLYELVFDPTSETADLFVDGIERISDYPGVSDPISPFVAWGARESAATGHGNYNLVEFVVMNQLVEIDIKPGSDPNCFSLNGNGVIPVAILGGPDFDVLTVNTDPNAANPLSFNGLKVRVRGNKGPLCSTEDVNSDGYLDLVCHFEDDPSQWLQGTDTSAMLTGELLDDTPIEGTDSICVVP